MKSTRLQPEEPQTCRTGFKTARLWCTGHLGSNARHGSMLAPWDSGLRAWCRLRDLELVLVHLSVDISEERRGEVTLGGVRNHCEDDGALGGLLADLQRGGYCRPAGSSAKDALLPRELHGRLHGILAVHQDDLVLQLQVQAILSDLGDEIGGPALDGVSCPRGVTLRRRAKLPHDLLALLFHATRDERRSLRLREDDLDIRPGLLYDLAGTLEGATRAITGHPVVKLAASKIGENLGPRGLCMEGRVRVVLKLPRQQPAMLLCKLLSLEHHACAAQGSGCHNHLGTKHPHDLSALH